MLKHKWYRAWRVLRGDRSFVKSGDIPTYALIGGSPEAVRDSARELVAQGFIEEWPNRHIKGPID